MIPESFASLEWGHFVPFMSERYVSRVVDLNVRVNLPTDAYIPVQRLMPLVVVSKFLYM